MFVRILLACCILQLAISAPAVESQNDDLHTLLRALNTEELEQLVELLLEGRQANAQRSTLDFESRKRELLSDSAALTDAVIEAERTSAANNQRSDAARLLRGFVKSTPYVQRVSQVAKKQLKAISTFKKEWDQVHGKNSNNDEFWKVVKSTNLMQPSTCSREADGDVTACLDTRTLESRSVDYCPLADPTCTQADRSIYRTFDGSCNNDVTGQRAWGMAPSAQVRILDPVYENGVDEPTVTGESGDPLPNARLVSLAINDRFVNTPTTFSYMVMQFGQFLDHDLTHTDASETVDEDGNSADIYCGCELDPDSTEAEECINIQIPSDDPRQAGARDCMEVVRSAAWPVADCVNSERQQVNSITAYLDCSQVYGSAKGFSNRLRDSDTTRGKMATTEHPTHPEWKPLLPLLNNKEQRTDCAVTDLSCFLAGDDRRNVQPGLTAMHTVWVRMHNYIEENLFALNPTWDGETLYQESRRLLIAITQHITYNEYLTLILGRRKMREENPAFGGARLFVNPDSTDYDTVYNSSVQANIANVFSTAAYRFGHSEINKYMKFLKQFAPVDDTDCNDLALDEADIPSHCVKLRETFNNPTTIYESPANTDTEEYSGVDSVLLGIINDASERVDLWYTEEITEYLFSAEPEQETTFGYDLFALNVERSRDHGLPGYMAWREHYGLDTTDSWEAMPSDYNEREWERLQEVYSTPRDIDVYPGGLLERHQEGAKTGILFREINGEQFLRIKLADRYWYENGDMDHSFTLDQLTEIRKMTLSSLFCLTLDNPGSLPQFSFELYDVDSEETNPLLTCADQPTIDFTPWIATDK